MEGFENVYIFDIEADNLYPFQEEIWSIRFKKYGEDKWLKLNPFREPNRDVKQEILDFIFEKPNPIIVAHNGLGYDHWVLWKEYGLEFTVGQDTICGQPVHFFDTLYASQYFLPDRKGGHSLKSWGERFDDNKIDFKKICIDKGVIDKGAPKGSEFKQYIPEMDVYCEKDCIVTEKAFRYLYTQLGTEKTINGFKLGQKNFYLMAAQGFTGVEFDTEQAFKLESKIEGMIQDLKNEVEPNLPKRNLKKSEQAFYTMPSSAFKKDGSISTHMENFLKRNNAEIIENDTILAYGKYYAIESKKLLDVKLPMNLEDQKELKQYFLDSGWKPTMWNVKKDSNGKAMRDDKRQLIKTSPKIQENGRICSNLEEMEADIPKKIVKFMSLRNRLGVLRGWMKHPRLEWDGRLPAGSSGIASTHRQKHTCVVNVPKAQEGVLLGKEFRSLFKAEEGHTMIGVDQAALEARVNGHWTYRYDGGENARLLIDGDIHSNNAKAFFPKETEQFDINAVGFDKEDPKFKPFRSRSKNGGYAIMYGCAAPKLATTLGLPEKKGKELLESYWKANPALKKLKDKVEDFWANKGESKWIPGLDGRRLYSRSQHSLINLLFQSSGAIIVDYSLALFDMKMGGLKLDSKGRPYYEYKGKTVKRIIYSHDEYQVSADSSIVEDISKLMEWTMEEAGRRLKLNIPLEGGASIGENWRDTH